MGPRDLLTQFMAEDGKNRFSLQVATEHWRTRFSRHCVCTGTSKPHTVHMFIIEGLMMIVVVGATRTRRRLVPRLVRLGGEE